MIPVPAVPRKPTLAEQWATMPKNARWSIVATLVVVVFVVVGLIGVRSNAESENLAPPATIDEYLVQGRAVAPFMDKAGLLSFRQATCDAFDRGMTTEQAVRLIASRNVDPETKIAMAKLTGEARRTC